MTQRFEREAQTIAALNHPNICTLYDVGHQGDIEFLVMEFLEGETLADRDRAAVRCRSTRRSRSPSRSRMRSTKRTGRASRIAI